MVDMAVTWLLNHPLYGVGVLASIAIGTGLFLVPRTHSLAKHDHPRC